MDIETTYFGGSGFGLGACSFIGQRYEQGVGFKSGDAESWILSTRDAGDDETEVRTSYCSDSWFTGVWRSATAAYVTDADLNTVYVTPIRDGLPDRTAWQKNKLDSPLYGIWGLSDRCIFAWGSTFAGAFPVFRFDGRKWDRIADPGFRIYAMHGTSPDLIYAVGGKGQIARFDGKAWQPFPSPTGENLTGVFVASGDEIYAVGRAGSVLEGSAHGWAKIAEGPGLPGPLHDVAVWKGQLWIAAGPFGLLRRVRKTNKLEVVKDNIPATRLDARQNLVMTTPNMIAATSDGKTYAGTADDSLLEFRDGKRLLDFS